MSTICLNPTIIILLDSFSIEEQVMFYPLQTVRRIMQLVYPPAVRYYLRTVRFDRDPELIRCITWGPDNSPSRVAISVFVQAPWILRSKDIRHFAACQSVSDLE